MKKEIVIGALLASLMHAKTHYDRVKVAQDAAPHEIRDNCRRRLHRYRNRNEKDQKRQELGDACEVLKDPEKKKLYDESLKHGTPASGANRGSTVAIEAPASQ